jgi:glucosamine-6-phosphate deaminase
MVLITGAHKAFALYKAIEEGVNHMWTVSAFQQHPRTLFICDEDATLELRVKTVKYFKVYVMNFFNRFSLKNVFLQNLWSVHSQLVDKDTA